MVCYIDFIQVRTFNILCGVPSILCLFYDLQGLPVQDIEQSGRLELTKTHKLCGKACSGIIVEPFTFKSDLLIFWPQFGDYSTFWTQIILYLFLEV